VVDALGPAFVLYNNATDAAEEQTNDSPGWARQARERVGAAVANARQWIRETEGAPEVSDRDRAVAELLKCCTVSAGRKSNMVGIECRGPSPQWAQQVVAKLIDLYQAEHMRLNRPQGSLEFFTEQSERSRRELTKKEEELRDLKTATGLASPADQRLALVTRITRLQDDLLQAEAARAVAESKVQVLRDQLATVPEKRVREQTAGVGNNGTDMMRQELYQLQIRKEEAAAKYTEAHPRMQQAIHQVAAAEEVVRNEEPTRTHVTTATNRVHEEAQLALMVEEPALASLQAKSGTLQRQLAGVRGELKSLNENELRIAKLQREVELCQVSYRKYATDLEQARIDMALQEQRMSNISVAQPATYEPKPVYPRKGSMLLFGLMFGVFGGVGLALLADWRDHSFHAAADVERRLDMAVLGSIPRLREKELKVDGNGKS
jgi:polysaccharide biosynthesis protein PslE